MTDDLVVVLRKLDEMHAEIRALNRAHRRPPAANHPLRRAAKILGVHPDRLRAHVALGHVKAVRFGKRWRIAQEEIDRIHGPGGGLPDAPPSLAAAAPPRVGRRPKSPPTREAKKSESARSMADRIRAIRVR